MAVFKIGTPYVVFFFNFFLLYSLLKKSFFISFNYSLIIYLCFGGWYFWYIFILTIRRDLLAFKGFILTNIFIYKFIWLKWNFVDLFYRTLHNVDKTRTAIYYDDYIWTFEHLDIYSNKIAHFLLSHGFKRGDVLGLFFESCPAYIGVWLGAAKIGVASGLININLKKSTLTDSITALGARGLIVSSRLKHLLDEICLDNNLNVQHIWTIGDDNDNSDLLFSNNGQFNSFVNKKFLQLSDSPPPFLSQINNCREHLLYIFTSGTTGLPKAAIISSLRFLIMTSIMHYMYKLKSSDIIYDPLPLYHTAGGVVGAGQMLLFGSTIVIRSKFSASHYWTDCIKYKCTVGQYIGEICRYLFAQPVRDTDKKHAVRLVLGNGIRPQIWHEFKQRFGIAQLAEFYGATESNTNFGNIDDTPGAIGFISRIAPWAFRIYFIRIDRDTQEPIRDAETGLCIICGPNEPGQVIGSISSTNPMRMLDCYLNREATAKKIVHNVFVKGDSWFATGDLMYYNELGYIYFVDRLGDTFRWRGENVSTTEVENILTKAIKSGMDATVYGVKIDGTEGRAGMAAIGLGRTPFDFDAELDLVHRIECLVKEHLPSYAQPLFLRLCAQLEMTSTYKICKRQLEKIGFDPNVPDNRVYFMDPKDQIYKLLDQTAYNAIVNGIIRY